VVEAHCAARSSALVGAGEFLALAVATAIAPFVFELDAALASVAGMLVQVPVTLSVVRLLDGSKHRCQPGAVGQGNTSVAKRSSDVDSQAIAGATEQGLLAISLVISNYLCI